MTFIERVDDERQRTAEFLITMIDSYRLMERYTSVYERLRLVDNINRMTARYDRVTRIQRCLQTK